MNQTVSLPHSGQETATLQVSTSTPRTFWHSFTAYSSPFEKFCIQRGYLFLLVLFAVEFVTNLVTDLIRGSSMYNDTWIYMQYQYFQLSYLYHASLYCLLIAGLFLTLQLGKRWLQSIPEFFQTLEQRCHLIDPQLGVEKSYQTYLEKYQRALLYGKGRILTRSVVIGAIILFIVVILVWRFSNMDIRYISTFAFTMAFMQSLSTLVEDFFFPLFFLYLTISFLWMMGATGLYIRGFVKSGWLRIQLSHPDNCGGFQFLGNFALNMALFIVASTTLIVFYIIQDYHWDGFTSWSIGASVLSLSLIVASYGAFFQPISAVHESMVKERRGYEDAVASHVAKIEEQINEALREGDASRLKTAREDLEVAQTLRPDVVGFPSWPFDLGMLIKFVSSQLIPFITVAVAIISAVLGFLQPIK